MDSMEFHGVHHGIAWNPWTSMEFHGIPWNSMELHGIAWNAMESMEFHGFHGIPWNPWNPMELIPWVPWTPMEFRLAGPAQPGPALTMK